MLARATWLSVTLGCLLAVATTHAQDTDDALDRFEIDAVGDGAAVIYDLSAMLSYMRTEHEPETTLRLRDDGTWATDALLRPRPVLSYASLSLAFSGEWEASPLLLVHWLADSGELRAGSTVYPEVDGVAASGLAVGDYFLEGLFVRELSVQLGTPTVSLDVGRQHAVVGSGLIYDDYGNGVALRLDLKRAFELPLRFEAHAMTTRRGLDSDTWHSGLFSASLDWEPRFLETVGIFGALYTETDGGVADVLRSAIAETLVLRDAPSIVYDALLLGNPGHGKLGYFGAHVDLYPFDKLHVRAAMLGSSGSFSVQAMDGENRSLSLRGYAGDLQLRYGLSDAIDVSWLGFVLSGDNPPSSSGERYTAFIAVAPYWSWGGLFFFGGVNRSLVGGRASAAGVNGHGVAGTGPSLVWSNDDAIVELRAIWLSAMKSSPPAPLGNGGTSYGIEVDLQGDWRALDGLSLGAELDLLVPGDYFVERNVAYRALVMLTVADGS